ncbi:hypothetical protein D8Y37_25035, partial [Escherichia coli]
CPLTDFGGKTSIFSHPVYLFLRKFSLQDSRGGSVRRCRLLITVTWSKSIGWIMCRSDWRCHFH